MLDGTDDHGLVPKLLLVEDEESISVPVARGLAEEGYAVDVASDGLEGLRMALVNTYDVLVVDWRLPGIDGRTLVERIRGAKVRTPLMMLTAVREVENRVEGLNAGADDYLTKPFDFDELLARLRALRRRAVDAHSSSEPASTRLEAGLLRMDTARRTVHVSDHLLELRYKEFRLLELLIRLEGRVATRTMIAEQVWGSAFDVSDNAIDVTVSNLRTRLANAFDPGTGAVSVDTVRGVGYRLTIAS
ncbi:MAG: response regulator transcription factor [Rhodothermales bacterium]